MGGQTKIMNCKTCKWCNLYYHNKEILYQCICDYEVYSENQLFDCNEYNMEVEVKPKDISS